MMPMSPLDLNSCLVNNVTVLQPTQVRPIQFWDIDRFQTVRWGDDTGVRSMF
jgi:hypothetical protein